MGKRRRLLTPNKLNVNLWALKYDAKFHQNRLKIVNVGAIRDRQILCLMSYAMLQQ